jgi:hypothetical protein
MSDEKYTQKEREFLKLHELGHTLTRLELAVIAEVGPRGLVNKSSNDRLRAWYALDVLRGVLFDDAVKQEYGEAADMIINKALAEDNDERDKVRRVRERLGIQYDKAEYANMTAQEIFQDLIAPTTEDNDDE